jgi:hypothetical protein
MQDDIKVVSWPQLLGGEWGARVERRASGEVLFILQAAVIGCDPVFLHTEYSVHSDVAGRDECVRSVTPPLPRP